MKLESGQAECYKTDKLDGMKALKLKCYKA